MKNIMLVFGTRPEAIKMAPLCLALKALPDLFSIKICITGQHRHMLDQALEAFGVIPDIDLNVMKSGQDLFDVTSSVLNGMKDVLVLNKPDLILVHGDTTTTLAAAMAGFYTGVNVGHVEAGLRTYDINAPYPEEFNRQVVSKIAKWHFAPTLASKDNLIKEGVNGSQVFVTGNTVVDSLFLILRKLECNPSRKKEIETLLNANLPFLWRSQRFVLITGHRRESFGDGFVQICKAINDLSFLYPSIHFVYPVHLNPNVQNPVMEFLDGLKNVHLIPPLDYEPFIYLLKHSYIVLTDSGGIQEEAPSLGKPVLVMRDITERPEALTAGTVRLIGANRNRIANSVSELLSDSSTYTEMSQSHNPYGDGKACERIIDILKAI